MKSIIVTGGAGFIGSNFAHYWCETYPEDKVLVLDSLSYAGNLHSLTRINNPNFSFLRCDINDTEKVAKAMRDHSVDTLVHFAAESHVDRSIDAPDIFLETNIIGTHSLLKVAKNYWDEIGIEGHFHHVSTDEVYGELTMDDEAFKESNPYLPNSPYSASKASSDFFVRAYHHTYGLKVTTSNCSNNYGPYHFPEKLIPLTILNILAGKNIPVYGDGKNIRDWLYVDDHSRGIDLVIQNGVPGETYNIGGNNEWTNIDIVKIICSYIDRKFSSDEHLKKKYPECPASNATASDSLISYVKDRAGHDFRYAVDTQKIQAALGYEPEITFETGIEMTIDWYLENDEWWTGVTDGSYRKLTAL